MDAGGWLFLEAPMEKAKKRKKETTAFKHTDAKAWNIQWSVSWQGSETLGWKQMPFFFIASAIMSLTCCCVIVQEARC
jgi:hypothetical protein